MTTAGTTLLQSSPGQQSSEVPAASSSKQGQGAGHYAAVTLMVAITFLTVCGNLCNFVVITRSWQLRHTLSNFFVLSLFTCDLLAGLLVLPAAAYTFAAGDSDAWPLGPAACDAAGFMGNWLTFVSMTTMASIAAERFYCIRWSMHHAARMSVRGTLGVLLTLWGLGAVLAALPLVGLNSYDFRPSLYNCSFDPKPETGHMAYVLLVTTICFLMPGVLIIVMYGGIFWVAHLAAVQVGPTPRNDSLPSAVTISVTATESTRSMSRQIGAINTTASSSSSNTKLWSRQSDASTIVMPSGHVKASTPSIVSVQHTMSHVLRTHIKPAKTVLLMVVPFILLWGPLFVMNLNGVLGGSLAGIPYLLLAAQWMGYSSFALNPFLFGWMNKSIRKELVALLWLLRLYCCCCCSCCPEQGSQENEDMQQDERPEMQVPCREENFMEFLERTTIHQCNSDRQPAPKCRFSVD
ncbi:hypothetical protein C0Q70_14840 [Pomacea canaliculata]|uniref:G-protein coupled receptors family 1 profile domain-containing protein n=1 Tax=Pomacea canaliculata TaxID=400727 RepID=A0A2T7NT64_POMCA|nr:probable G-protein coupled receptor [Pomacea canaliculata]XP_025106819.1 probable G-protein coupled receptor [Pomacea canaliculata]PVD24359.1 hypothetical protein C0Q70_14840 [Pomacea canaliculata]